jgi:hypothetical protein
MTKTRFLDKTYLGENPKAPQTNATPCLANTTLNSHIQLLFLIALPTIQFYAIVPQEISAI